MANHVSRDDLPAERMGEWEGRVAELGEYTVTFEKIPAGFRPAATTRFAGFPMTPARARTGATCSAGRSRRPRQPSEFERFERARLTFSVSA